jgi:hypothetical protein
MLALARSAPTRGPAMETWLLFSFWLVLLESGKWMWQPVASMTCLMVLPPLPMM